MSKIEKKQIRTEIGPASGLLRNMGDMMVNMQSDAVKLFECVKDIDGFFSKSILMDAIQYSGLTFFDPRLNHFRLNLDLINDEISQVDLNGHQQGCRAELSHFIDLYQVIDFRIYRSH